MSKDNTKSKKDVPQRSKNMNLWISLYPKNKKPPPLLAEGVLKVLI
ncbi:hypothetical protein K1X76_10360 [bacterium]|nr:hypothetical protein [bacterium]